MKHCTIIGISDSRKQWFAPDVKERIDSATVFSGGKRHHEIMKAYLPKGTTWIDITVPLSQVFEQYNRYEDIVIFASGDPLFFGFANTVQRELPDCQITLFPSFNSLQALAHKVCLPYHDMHVVSLTGRPWNKFDEALIKGYDLIGVLTDKTNTPHAIIQRMLEYGYNNYEVIIGENLGNEETERISSYKLTQFVNDTFDIPSVASLNCMILRKTKCKERYFGIPETDFHLLNNRAKMITKMPIRLLSLAMLDLSNRQSFWDVGFCTGSISIEAKLQFPYLHITAFEIRPEGEELMLLNSKKFGTPGIQTVIGDFLVQDVNAYERPDAVFIGGHGGKLKEIIHKIHEVLLPDGVIVFNSVSEESRSEFEQTVQHIGMQLMPSTNITIDNHNPITILKCKK